MQRKFTDHTAVTVHMETDEYKWIVLQAGGLGNLSAWARERLTRGIPSTGVPVGQLNEGAVRVRFSNGAEPRRAEQAVARRDSALLDGPRANPVSAEMPPAPTKSVCVNCEHPKHKHGGFKGACQFEQCLCGGFE